MLRNFPYFKTNKSSEPLEDSSSKPHARDDCHSKTKKLLLASRQIRRNQVRPGVPHQRLIGLLKRSNALNIKPPQHRETKPSTSRHIQTETDDLLSEDEMSCENISRQRKLESIHQESEELFKECSIFKNQDPSLWHQCDINKKLIYYWTTINTVCPDPFAFKNFMVFYISKNKRAKNMTLEKAQKKCLSIWKNMRYHEKLPFITESLISHFSKLPNPTSRKMEHQIRAFFVASRKE